MKVKVLGTEYEIISIEETNDNLEQYPLLKDNSGYTDITTKQIFILKYKSSEDTFIDLDVMYKKTLRHELVHAFLYESGLFNNSNNDWAKNEEIVDWIAIQFEKMLEVFVEVEALSKMNIKINMDSPKLKVAKASIKDNTDIVNEIGKAIKDSMPNLTSPKIEIPNYIGVDFGNGYSKSGGDG